MKVALIAAIAHAINAAYCASLGDTSQPTWEDAPEWQKNSAIAGVEMHLANPDATPEQSHESWLAQKVADGWVHGTEKDAEAKTHPCCLPYDQLPPEQKAKDYLFRAVVHALKDVEVLDDESAQALADEIARGDRLQNELDRAVARLAGPSQSVATPSAGFASNKVPVEYIGRRPTWTDHHYGTGLVFTLGETKPLTLAVAKQLLRHPDLFQRGDLDNLVAPAAPEADEDEADQAAAQQKAKEDQQRLEVNRHHDLIAQVKDMTKASLAEFALTRFGVKIDPRASGNTRDAMEAQVVQLIHAHGTVV